jgi:hypothetical protein
MRTDFFLHKGAWVHYLVFGNSERGYKAKADVSLLKSYPAEYVPIRLENLYATLEEAEGAIIDFCKRFIEENRITETEGIGT